MPRKRNDTIKLTRIRICRRKCYFIVNLLFYKKWLYLLHIITVVVSNRVATRTRRLNSFRYLTSTTEYKDDANGTYILQDGSNTAGFLGSPAFIQEEDKSYKCVGVYVGNMFGRPRIVPINRCY